MITTHPLLKFFFGESLLDELLQGCQAQKLPPHFSPIPAAFIKRFRKSFFKTIRPQRFLAVQVLHGVHVTPEGRIFSGWKIHRCSDLYPLLKPKSALYWLTSRRRGGDVSHIEEAWFVPLQIIKRGSYGDYWDEYLTALSFHRPPPGSRILLPPHYAAKHARPDLEALGLEIVDLRDSEVRVGTLHVLPPCQFFDNFLPETTAAIQAAFPDRVSPVLRQPGRKVYLSRLGFSRPREVTAAATGRQFDNEDQVEDFLRQRGFTIVRTHEASNEEARRALVGADIVVAAHGASMFHILWSPPRALIELASIEWFLPTFSKFAAALGISHYDLLDAPAGTVDLKMLALALDKVAG